MSGEKWRFRRGLGFPYKITLMITFILAFGVGVNLFLNYINFKTSYEELVQSRFEVVSADLKNTIESGLTLGLGLAEMKNVQALLEEIPQTQADISLVKVFTANGSVLFDADTMGVGTSVPAIWQESTLRSKEGVWQVEEDALIVQGVALLNSFNEQVGTLVIGYPSALVYNTTSQVSQYLLWTFLLSVLVFTLLTAVLIRMKTNGIVKSFKRMGDSLSSVTTTGETVLSEPVDQSKLEEEFVAFQSTYQGLKERMQKLHEGVNEHLAIDPEMNQAPGHTPRSEVE